MNVFSSRSCVDVILWPQMLDHMAFLGIYYVIMFYTDNCNYDTYTFKDRIRHT